MSPRQPPPDAALAANDTAVVRTPEIVATLGITHSQLSAMIRDDILVPTWRRWGGGIRGGTEVTTDELLCARAALTLYPIDRRGDTHWQHGGLVHYRCLIADAVRAHPDRRWLLAVPALDRAWTTDEAADVTAALASGELVRVLCLDELRP